MERAGAPEVMAQGIAPSLGHIKRIEQHARVVVQSKDILDDHEIIAALHHSLFGTETLPPQTSAVVKRAVGVIAVERGVASPTAILALELGRPAIVGVEDALTVFQDGELITLDPLRGLVYEGQVRV